MIQIPILHIAVVLCFPFIQFLIQIQGAYLNYITTKSFKKCLEKGLNMYLQLDTKFQPLILLLIVHPGQDCGQTAKCCFIIACLHYCFSSTSLSLPDKSGACLKAAACITSSDCSCLGPCFSVKVFIIIIVPQGGIRHLAFSSHQANFSEPMLIGWGLLNSSQPVCLRQ